jgi:hypothetical protein
MLSIIQVLVRFILEPASWFRPGQGKDFFYCPKVKSIFWNTLCFCHRDKVQASLLADFPSKDSYLKSKNRQPCFLWIILNTQGHISMKLSIFAFQIQTIFPAGEKK